MAVQQVSALQLLVAGHGHLTSRLQVAEKVKGRTFFWGRLDKDKGTNDRLYWTTWVVGYFKTKRKS